MQRLFLAAATLNGAKGLTSSSKSQSASDNLTDKKVLFCWMGDTSPTLDQTARSIDVNDPDSPVLFLGVKENHKDYLLAATCFLLTSREDYSSLAAWRPLNAALLSSVSKEWETCAR